MKPVVHYNHVFLAPKVGRRAVVATVDHPSERVTNEGGPVFTSDVVSIGPGEGEFETQNTRYVPAK